jgi:hemolysin activation/secretion protein
LKIGDRFDTAILRTKGVTYGSLDYTIPIGYSGLNFGINLSSMSYDVVNGEAENLDLSGISRTIAFDASYPLIRSRVNNLNLTTSLGAKQLVNRSSFGNESDYKIKTFDIGANYQDLTYWLMGGEFYGSINFGLGHNDYGDSPITFRDSKKNEDTNGSHTIISGTLNYTQFFTDISSITFKFSGQHGNKNLDSSEKFYLGGARTVRAYPTSEIGGTHGFLFNIDHNYILTDTITLNSFYDHGYVKQYKKDVNRSTNQALTIEGNSNDVTLRGYGFSLKYLGPYDTSFEFMWSDRIGSNPNRSNANIDNSNGETARPMTWFSGSINFYF